MPNLQTVVAEVFNMPLAEVNDELTRGVLEAWDSFNHLVLISVIEKQLGIQFTLDEVASIQSYKQLKEIVSKKHK
jgi:acyl carrier protein